MTYEQFIAKFPEFRQTSRPTVCAALEEASRWVSAVVWGNLQQDGIGYWAADALAISPFGTGTQLEPGTQGRTTYKVKFEELRTSVVGGFAVAGGW